MRRTPLLACMALTLALCACSSLNGIQPKDLSGKPTVYAVVNKAPDPALLGCYVRSRPEEYRRPNNYEFCLVKQGEQYALYYYIKDGKSMAVYKNWSPCRIDGDSVTSGYDGSRYFVKNGQVWQMTTVGGPHRMLPQK